MVIEFVQFYYIPLWILCLIFENDNLLLSLYNFSFNCTMVCVNILKQTFPLSHMWPCTCCLVCKKKIEAIRNHECGYSFIPSFVFSFELFRSVHLLSHNWICVWFNFQFCNFMFCEHQICIPLARRFYFFHFLFFTHGQLCLFHCNIYSLEWIVTLMTNVP